VPHYTNTETVEGQSLAVLQQLGMLVPTFRPSSEWKSVVPADQRITPVAVPARTILQPGTARGAA
jgi:hypothetical protein